MVQSTRTLCRRRHWTDGEVNESWACLGHSKIRQYTSIIPRGTEVLAVGSRFSTPDLKLVYFAFLTPVIRTILQSRRARAHRKQSKQFHASSKEGREA